jgi:hypothetical protein
MWYQALRSSRNLSTYSSLTVLSRQRFRRAHDRVLKLIGLLQECLVEESLNWSRRRTLASFFQRALENTPRGLSSFPFDMVARISYKLRCLCRMLVPLGLLARCKLNLWPQMWNKSKCLRHAALHAPLNAAQILQNRPDFKGRLLTPPTVVNFYLRLLSA